MAKKILLPRSYHIKSKQNGIALVLITFILTLIVTGFGIKFLSGGSPQIHNNVTTNQALLNAKSAVIGNVIAGGTSTNTGIFPCSEDTTAIGFSTEGQANSSCSNTQVSIGRFAWRTMGTGDVRDGNSDKLWYALSPGFRTAPINSDSISGLAIDGVQNRAIAMVFSPGGLLTSQTRPAPTSSVPPNVNAYLDGENSDGDIDFITGSSATFNDKSLSIQSDDVFPILEKQVLGTVANYLKDYKLVWGAFPFPASFSNPSTASYIGSLSNVGGLLPIADAGVTWLSGTAVSVRASNGSTQSGTCVTSLESQVLTCTILNQIYTGPRTITVNARLNNVGLGFYTPMVASNTSDFGFTPAAMRSTSIITHSLTASGGGAVTLTATATTSSLLGYKIVFNRPPQWVNWSTTAQIPNYIYQNNWHHLIYYKVAQPFLPGGSLLCGTSCLTVNRINVTPNTTQTDIHALLISAGRKLDTTNIRPTPIYNEINPAQVRPGSDLIDYYDSANNITNGQVFDSTNHPLTTFNDQIEVVEP